MRNKGNNSDVAHFWANQVQSELSNANGSFYYTNKIIFSYGSHFPIAKHINDIVLFTTHSYSNTTAKHISHAFRAVMHKKVFHVSDVLACNEEQHLSNFEDYNERFTDTIKKAVRARSNKAWLLEQAEKLANEANEYAQYFDLDIIPIDTSKLDMDSIKETLKREKIEKAKQAKIQKAKLLKEQAENIANWRNGERVHIPYTIDCMLRINAENETIETSQGANVPLSVFSKVWKHITICKETNSKFLTPLSIGHYTLREISANGDLTVGCHHMKYAELLLLAKQLKLA